MKTIEIEGIYLHVEYKLFPATKGSFYEPPEGATIEIISVSVDETDIYPLLADKFVDKIESIILDGKDDDEFSYIADNYDD